MGSYLSIVNDTKDPWQCKIGPDEAALKIAGIAMTVVATLATVLATAGSAAPVAASLAANNVVAVFGVSTKAIATIAGGAALAAKHLSKVGDVSDYSMQVAEGLSNKLKDDGFTIIEPGKSHRWGKMSLSLWQQGTCVKTVLVDPKTVRVETLYMRPIFSGATKDSNNDHKIQWWIDKWGTEKEEIVAHTESKRLLSAESEQWEETPSSHVQAANNEVHYFYPNGTTTTTTTTTDGQN